MLFCGHGTLKAVSGIVYLTGSPSVAKADFFKSYTAGINACSTH
jgi:hypothetical protein